MKIFSFALSQFRNRGINLGYYMTGCQVKEEGKVFDHFEIGKHHSGEFGEKVLMHDLELCDD